LNKSNIENNRKIFIKKTINIKISTLLIFLKYLFLSEIKKNIGLKIIKLIRNKLNAKVINSVIIFLKNNNY
tara:strand:+ start:57 stop:269 length:213 start_codon:yes stop_codon:yes gene_type:complete